MSELTIGEVYRAQMVLKDVARHPKIIGPTTLSDSCRIYLKPENLQHTGSFKLRGAYYKISQLSEEEKKRGVIACSAGNHAQGKKNSQSSQADFPRSLNLQSRENVFRVSTETRLSTSRT